ncbi:MAG: hypothetical protein R3C49_25360 [Planctomycetaceae bacterium]
MTRLMLICALLTAVSSTGCSKFRQLTRRDYAALQDPFLDQSALAEKEAPAKKGTSGFVKIDDTAGSATTAAAPGTSAGRTTAQAGTAMVSQSKTVADAGAAKSFPGVRAQGVSNSVVPGSGPSLSDFVSKPAQSAGSKAVAVTAAAATNDDADLAQFTEFLEGQAEASGLTDTARQLDSDFATFAAQRKQEWSAQTAAVTSAAQDKASPLINTVRNAEAAVSDRAEPLIQQIHAETAAPLIEPVRKTAAAAGSAFSDAAKTAKQAVANPFEAIPFGQPAAAETPRPKFDDAPSASSSKSTSTADDQWNPFAAFESAPASSAAKPNETEKPKTLDSGFQFDSGWRPSNLKLE